MIEWIESLLVEIFAALVIASLAAIWWKWGPEWTRKIRNWIHRFTAPPSTPSPDPIGEHCEQEMEVETTPPSASKIWRVRGYCNDNVSIGDEQWVASRAEAIKICDYLNYQGVVVKNVVTGEIARAVGKHPKQHNRKMDVSHLPATDPDDPDDLPF